jgi:hypothetical protein
MNTSLNISILEKNLTTTQQASGKGLFYEIFWTFLIPMICFFGTLTNLISMISLAKMRTKNHMFKFMLSSSATSAIYNFLCGFIFLLRCGTMCNTNTARLELILYSFAIWDYLTSSLAILISSIEIIMCIQRYSVIANWEKFQFKRFNLIFPILISMSLLIYLPRIFFKTINEKAGKNNEFELVNTSFKTSTLGIVLDILMSVIRGPVCLIIIIIINIFTGIKFVKLIKKKKKMKGGQMKSSNSFFNNIFFLSFVKICLLKLTIESTFKIDFMKIVLSVNIFHYSLLLIFTLVKPIIVGLKSIFGRFSKLFDRSNIQK